MPVNYAKEYLIFVQTGVVFLPFHVRVKNGRHYSNFEKKISNLRFISFIIYIFRKSLLGCDFQEPKCINREGMTEWFFMESTANF